MKSIVFILLSICFLIGCSDNNITHQESVTQFYTAFDTSNYSEIQTHINDTITLISGDYKTPYNTDTFYEYFKWDSIFKTSYKIVDIKEQNDTVFTTVSSSSSRYEFLQNNPLRCEFKISFNNGKISEIKTIECAANWSVWQQERDSLVSWIDKKHPEFNGFIYDMTMDGAINYLKAIEVYKGEK